MWLRRVPLGRERCHHSASAPGLSVATGSRGGEGGGGQRGGRATGRETRPQASTTTAGPHLHADVVVSSMVAPGRRGGEVRPKRKEGCKREIREKGGGQKDGNEIRALFFFFDGEERALKWMDKDYR